MRSPTIRTICNRICRPWPDPRRDPMANPFTDVFLTPQRRFNVSPRLDYQISPNNTLSVRYHYSRSDIQDSGIGSFNLISRGFESLNTHQTVQLTDTQVIGGTIINEARF